MTIIIIGISMGAAGKYWSNVMLREKEEELLFRGQQYRQAIDRYFYYLGKKQYPQSIDDLLKDSRSAAGKRHLRQQYKDPITGEDFEEIKHPATKRIIGVRSTSNKASLKQAEFPPDVLVPISAGTYSIPLPFIAQKTSESADFSFDNESPASDEASVASDKMKYSDWLFLSSTITSSMGGVPPGGGGIPPGGGGVPPGGGGIPPGGGGIPPGGGGFTPGGTGFPFGGGRR
ncbi:MAG: type II secretion system GspH family protein [Nitrospirae bacterium]|nr:type II secretion system GspH family protein [Nitrospirota bacterium]